MSRLVISCRVMSYRILLVRHFASLESRKHESLTRVGVKSCWLESLPKSLYMPQSLTRVVDIFSYLLHSGSWACLVLFIFMVFLWSFSDVSVSSLKRFRAGSGPLAAAHGEQGLSGAVREASEGRRGHVQVAALPCQKALGGAQRGGFSGREAPVGGAVSKEKVTWKSLWSLCEAVIREAASPMCKAGERGEGLFSKVGAVYASAASLPQAQAVQVAQVQMQPARLSHHGQRMGVARVPMGRAMSTSALHAQVELLLLVSSSE